MNKRIVLEKDLLTWPMIPRLQRTKAALRLHRWLVDCVAWSVIYCWSMLKKIPSRWDLCEIFSCKLHLVRSCLLHLLLPEPMLFILPQVPPLLPKIWNERHQELRQFTQACIFLNCRSHFHLGHVAMLWHRGVEWYERWWWRSTYSAILGADLFARSKTMIVKRASDSSILVLPQQLHSIPYFRTLLNVNQWILQLDSFVVSQRSFDATPFIINDETQRSPQVARRQWPGQNYRVQGQLDAWYVTSLIFSKNQVDHFVSRRTTSCQTLVHRPFLKYHYT